MACEDDERKLLMEDGFCSCNIEADILLLRDGEMTRGHVVAQSHDANVNITDRAHTSSILDTI